MSGSVGLNAPCYMPALSGSGARGSSLLATLSGYRNQSAGAAAAAPGANGGTAEQIAPQAPTRTTGSATPNRTVEAARSAGLVV